MWNLPGGNEKRQKKLVRIAGLCMEILIWGKLGYLEFKGMNDTAPRKYHFFSASGFHYFMISPGISKLFLLLFVVLTNDKKIKYIL
jgi:hypothetical protein